MNTITRRVLRLGENTVGVVIPRPVAEYLGLVPGSKVRLSIEKLEAESGRVGTET